MSRTHVLILLVGLFQAGASAGTYYIDFARGSDADSGTSKSSPWKHAPGMQNCSGKCATTTPQPGDAFVFKGGVRWDSTCFGWRISKSGTPEKPISYGVDRTWYAGSAWARPIFDAEYKTSLPEIYPGNNSVIAVWADYVNLDSFEVTGLMAKYSFGPALVNAGGNNVLSNLYLHGWDLINSITKDDAHGAIIANRPTGPITVAHCRIENSARTGTATRAHQNGLAIRGVGGEIRNNTIHDVSSAMLGVSGNIHGNTFYNVGFTPLGDHTGNRSFDPSYHVNLMYVNGSAVVYNNLYYDSNMPTNYYLEACRANGGESGTIYAFNNVGIVRDVGGAAIINIDTEGAKSDGCGTWYVWNNTLQRNDNEGGQFIIVTPHPYKAGTVVIRNNHLIGNHPAPLPSCDQVSGTCVVKDNTLQTNISADLEGYTFENHFSPIDLGGATVKNGEKLTPLCEMNSGILCSDRLNTPRPQTGSWDVGAYQYKSIQASDLPASPGNLTAEARY